MIPQGFLGALVRYVVLYGLGWLAAHNVIPTDAAAMWSGPLTEWLTNGLITFGMIAWLWARKRRQELEKAEAHARMSALTAMNRRD
jgi:putative flippase GtrA